MTPVCTNDLRVTPSQPSAIKLIALSMSMCLVLFFSHIPEMPLDKAFAVVSFEVACDAGVESWR